MTDLQFDPSERQYLLEHFRVKFNEAARSERPGAAEVAQTWLKLQQLFVSTTSPNKVGVN